MAPLNRSAPLGVWKPSLLSRSAICALDMPARLNASVRSHRAVVAQLLIFSNRTSQLVSALHSPGPTHCHVDPFGLSPDGNGDALYQAADDCLPFLDSGAG